MLWFRAPQKVYLKKGCMPVALDELGHVMGKKKCFIVTDSFLYQNGYVKPIEEKLDEMKLERAIERAMIEETDEAVEEAERIKRQNDSPDIQMTDMVDLADSADLKKSVDQNLGDNKSSMKVLEADLKGIKVDEEA